jgi:uncharacterized protein
VDRNWKGVGVLDALRKKAETGDTRAQYELATSLANIKARVHGCEESFYWYMKAALKGHAEAMWHAGLQLFKGEGVEPAIEAGLHLIHLSADRCCCEALRFLGGIYNMGSDGVMMDRQKGDYYYRLANEIENSDIDPHIIKQCYEFTGLVL